MRAAPKPAIEAAGDGTGPAPRRKLAALLCADVAGFNRLMGADESGTYSALSRLRAAIDPVVAQRGGRIVSTAGDGLLADFPRPTLILLAMQPSTLPQPTDMAKGRRTEIEFLNGFVVREGERVGLPARANEHLVEIVKQVERGDLKQDPRNITELRLN